MVPPLVMSHSPTAGMRNSARPYRAHLASHSRLPLALPGQTLPKTQHPFPQDPRVASLNAHSRSGSRFQHGAKVTSCPHTPFSSGKCQIAGSPVTSTFKLYIQSLTTFTALPWQGCFLPQPIQGAQRAQDEETESALMSLWPAGPSWSPLPSASECRPYSKLTATSGPLY